MKLTDGMMDWNKRMEDLSKKIPKEEKISPENQKDRKMIYD
jgi:hypothetical protein